MYNADGEKIWERQLDLNGKVISGDNDQCPFTFQGQYYDKEINLSYNRFRYYDAEDGRYISQDPIGLASGEFGFYNYVEDSNAWVDEFGLEKSYKAPGKPSIGDGFIPDKKHPGYEKFGDFNGKKGWLDSSGNLWVPTGEGPLAHGGPHWDVQKKDGGYYNVYPGGKKR